MVTWVGRNRLVVTIATAVAFALCMLVSYGFRRWWPGGCSDFNTDLQRSLTVERAREVTDRCPHVTASQVQETLAVDTVFPFLYTIFLAGSLLLLASWPLLARGESASAVWFARAAIVGGVLDLTLENGSLVLVTLQSWPPSSTGLSEALLLVAGLAAWSKAGLLIVALGALVVLVLTVAARGALALARRR